MAIPSVSGWIGPAIAPAAAQVIPATDQVNTTVTASDRQFDIQGGIQSGSNLFHSFETFDLQSGDIANFIAHPDIQNILGRITGGQASLIDGLIQVTGGNAASLYLLNPTGILLGPNSRLNLQGSFTATTADGLGFGSYWFRVFENNDYATLLGDPTGFLFTPAVPGSVVNAGELAVAPGQSLTLLGGSVITLGSLSAPDGEITVAAIPGQRRLRLSQTNHLLSLELELLPAELATAGSLNLLDLPMLLTGGDRASTTQIAVNADGSLRLTEAGAAIATDVGLAIATGHLQGQAVTVLGDRIALIGADIDAATAQGGGHVRIGGDYQGLTTLPRARRTYVDQASTITVDALETGDGGTAIVWADDLTGFYGTASTRGGAAGGDGGLIEISGRNRLVFEGAVSVLAPSGAAGTVLFDPANITIVAGTGIDDGQLASGVPAGDPAGQILAGDGGGSDFQIGAITLGALAGNLLLQATNDITVAAGVALDFVPGGAISFTAGGDFAMDPGQTITAPGRDITITAADLAIGSIDTAVSGLLAAGDISLTATSGSITTAALNTLATDGGSGGRVILRGATGITTEDINTFAETALGNAGRGGDIIVSTTAGEITTANLRSFANAAPPASGNLATSESGGAIRLTTGGGSITTADLFSFTVGRLGNAGRSGGAVELTANGGAIATGNLDAFAFADLGTPGQGGAITLTADGALTLAAINPNLVAGSSNVAPVTLTSQTDSITTGAIQNAGLTGGNVTLQAANTVTTGPIDTQGLAGQAGNSLITAGRFFRVVGSLIDQNGINASLSSAAPEGGGSITIRHGGGLLNQPFAVGDASVNGTEAAITTGVNNRILPPQSFPGSYLQDNIRILTPTSDPFERSAIAASPPLPMPESESAVASLVYALERSFTSTYEQHFGHPGEASIKTLAQIRHELLQVEALSGVRPAIIYAFFLSPDMSLEDLLNRINRLEAIFRQSHPEDQPGELQWRFISNEEVDNYTNLLDYVVTPETRQQSQLVLLLVSGRQSPVLRSTEMQFADLTDSIVQLNRGLRSDTDSGWVAPARALHQVLVEPLAVDLQARDINNLVFILDTQLRYLPLASLYGESASSKAVEDSAQIRILPVSSLQDANGDFLIDHYSVGLMPSMSLTDTRYRSLQPLRLLAMGTDQFASLPPLPGVASELRFLSDRLDPRAVTVRQDADFTLYNLQTLQATSPFNVLHLATHAWFSPDDPKTSFIQFWGNERLTLADLAGLNLEGVDLLTLSACETALGDEQVELGFAGLAYQAGVRTALASLRPVSDAGTFALMSQFYTHLGHPDAPIKAEALRQAQLAMKDNQVMIRQGILTSPNMDPYSLQTGLTYASEQNLQHPHNWAWFTLVGSPW